MDSRKNNGGHKAGRKSKAEEQSLIEKLTPLEPTALEALKSALSDEKKHHWSVKLFFEYFYGKPKQQEDNEKITDESQVTISPKSWV